MKTLTKPMLLMVAGALLAAPAMSATALPAPAHTANGDTDIYFAEGVRTSGTNILVNDDAGVHRQAEPAIGVDAAGDPYIVCVDNRSSNDEIRSASVTTTEPPLCTTAVPGEGGAVTVRSATAENLQVQIPAGALPEGMAATDISMAEVSNPPELPTGGFGKAYSLGPSGVVFNSPVTIRMPLADNAPACSIYLVYHYDAGTGAWTQAGIHNPAAKAADGSYLQVQVDHFSTFAASGVTIYGYGCGGGAHALSRWNKGGPVEVILPFVTLVLVLLTRSIMSGLRRCCGGTRS